MTFCCFGVGDPHKQCGGRGIVAQNLVGRCRRTRCSEVPRSIIGGCGQIYGEALALYIGTQDVLPCKGMGVGGNGLSIGYTVSDAIEISGWGRLKLGVAHWSTSVALL